jgi:hypothetical protein
MAYAPTPANTKPEPPTAAEAAALLNEAWRDPEWGLTARPRCPAHRRRVRLLRHAGLLPAAQAALGDCAIDPTRVITHRLTLAEAPHGYDIFKNKRDGCEKVVLRP